MKRRTFLTSLLAAPSLVRASSLEYVPRGLIMPKPKVFEFGSRIWISAAAGAGELRGAWSDGESLAVMIRPGTYRITIGQGADHGWRNCN